MITLELFPTIGHHITKFYEIISEPTLPSKTKSQAQVFSSTWRLAPRAKMITDVICVDSDADLKVDGFEPHSFTYNVFGKFTTHTVL